ncbi:MAG: amidohydrolase family protein [Planctomycetota bacterium]|nr:amidohydrolase family protein [Planctomycetota bacterium]
MLTKLNRIQCPRVSTLTRVMLATVLVLFPAMESWAAPAKLALTGGRIITVSGAAIEKGTILIEDGIITAVGDESLEIPYDAMEVDCTGMILAPGFVHPHSKSGLDVPNENLPVAPFVDVYDAIDPSRFFFEDSLRNGVSTIHVMQGDNCVVAGVSRIVHPIGLSPDEMTSMAGIALKMSTSPRNGYDRLRQLAELREVFSEYDRWREDLAEKRYEQEAESDEELDPLPPEEARAKGRELIRDEDLDDRHRNLAKLEDGRLGVWIYCGSASDVAPALTLISDRGWKDRAVLVLGGDSHLAVKEIAESGLPVVLDDDLVHRKRDVVSGDVVETFVPSVFAKAGVKFAIQPSENGSMPERFLGYQAARLARSGMSQAKALRTVTLTAAEICGVADRYGSIEVGKVGNIVMWTADPLELTSWVQKVWIKGILAYDREQDARLQRLFPDPETPPAPEGEPLQTEGEEEAEPGTDEKSTIESDAKKPAVKPTPLEESKEGNKPGTKPGEKPKEKPGEKPGEKPSDKPGEKPGGGGR